MPIAFKRILLKLSGEALAGDKTYSVDPQLARRVAAELKDIYESGVEIGIVVGGGNIYRGAPGALTGIPQASGDFMGMLATVINALALKEFFEQAGMQTTVFTAIQMDKIAPLFVRQKALQSLAQKKVVIIAAGTGNPCFTTDTAAALRCIEIEADLLIKATKVDGIYDMDPVNNPDAVKIDLISHEEALRRGLKILDAAAFSLCMDHAIPIKVIKLFEHGNLRKCVEGASVGSLVKKGANQ
ncbi:MAG: UMP kinase [Chitinivibrionales bacterium]|nr:UMP kinase [Chitinivibrionales bacterium]